MFSKRIVLASVAVLVFGGGLALWWHDGLRPVSVPAVDETHPVDGRGDAADDPAIWVDPADAASSLVLGTDKKGGLAVYDLQGHLLQLVPQPGLNNVDVRDGFRLGTATITLIAASDKEEPALRFYRLDPKANPRVTALETTIPLTIEGLGVCLFHDRRDGAFFAFAVGRDDEGDSFAEQWRLDGSDGNVRASFVRRVAIGGRAEGCVADDLARCVYVSEERAGIWMISADPSVPEHRELVLRHRMWHGLEEDLEGVALAVGPDGRRLLVVSNQGDDEFLVLDRDAGHRIVGRFTVAAADAVDRVSKTDGIDIVATPLGAAFPDGLLVVQDNSNERKPQNFKYVRWGAVLRELGLTTHAKAGR